LAAEMCCRLPKLSMYLKALKKIIVNYNFEDDIDNKFSVTTQPNLCFWFRIKVQTVRAFEKNLQLSNRQRLELEEGTFGASELAVIEPTPPDPKGQGMPAFFCQLGNGGHHMLFRLTNR
jgi:hypothetical protein